MTKKNNQIKDSIFTKFARPDELLIEFEKSKRAYELSREYPFFQVPKPLHFSYEKELIQFEAIPDIMSIKDFINLYPDKYYEKMYLVGKTLACVHDNLSLPASLKKMLPERYDCDDNSVVLHGDFCHGNIFIDANEKLFVIDWQTTPKIGGTVTCGTRYFDLMLFIYSLFYRPRGRSRYEIHLPGDVLATAFIEGYFANLQAEIDIDKFRSYMRKFYLGKVSSRIEKRKFKRFVLLIPCHMKLKKFIRKFKITGVQ